MPSLSKRPARCSSADVPEPEISDPGDAIVQIEATGVCGSDLHIYHGRVKIEPGFTIGHEYVGTVLAVGDAVHSVAGRRSRAWLLSDRLRALLFLPARLVSQVRLLAHVRSRRGARLAAGHTGRAGAWCPAADLVLRKVPAGMSDETALFAGDVMGTGFHAVVDSGLRPGEVAAVLGLGPVGLCAVQAARACGAAHVIAIDTVPERLAMAESFGAQAVHLSEGDPRTAAREASEGRGVDVCIDAVGHPQAFDLALKLTRKCGTVQAVGVYAERAEVHMGLLWIKSLHVCAGHANVIGHVDRVMAMMSAGLLDPTALVTHHMSLEQAPEAYALYDRREALKIVLTP